MSITATADDRDSIDFFALWQVVWGYKWLIAGIAVVCTAIAVVLALIATPMFRAEVSIAEAGDAAMGGGALKQLGGLASLAGIDIGGGAGSVPNAQAVLKSRKLVEDFIVRYDLLPILFPKSKRPPTLWKGVKMFRDHLLTIREDKRNSVLTVSINWEDPEIAARWANAFVALANETLRTRALTDSTRNLEYLNAQIKNTNVVELQKVLYNLIENESKTQMLANARAEYAFTVIDPAVAPEIRYSPRRTFMVLVGGFLGVMLGIAVAFVLDARRRGRRVAA